MRKIFTAALLAILVTALISGCGFSRKTGCPMVMNNASNELETT